MQALRDNARFIDHGGQKMYGSIQDRANAILRAAKYAVEKNQDDSIFVSVTQVAIQALWDGKEDEEVLAEILQSLE